jgi:hypothetical protein
MKQLLTVLAVAGISVAATAQQRRPANIPAGGTTPATSNPAAGMMGSRDAKTGPKPYKEVITDKAVSRKGLFTVHKVEDKWYFEIPDSILRKEIMAVTRFSKVAGGGGVYGGEIANQVTLQFEKGPSNNVFLRTITLISMADSTNDIYKAVSNSYLNPIAAAFDIKAFGKDSASVVIEVTDFFKGDNQVVSINPSRKRMLNLTALSPERSYISAINTYPINTEVRTVKTFISTPAAGFGAPSSGPTSRTLPAASQAGAVTLETNTSFIILPGQPMARRFFDPRVGFFADDFERYSDDQQKVKDETFIVRWRLEPKAEDLEKFRRGELVEPKKPIVYYIDPATPRKWVPYLIAGVNDWQKAFEKAGFKNAIMAKEWPNDSTMSLEDARFSVIRYFASDIANAYGPNVHDPRSGEILESHIGWYHNVMSLVHDWYMLQAAAVDPRARKMKFDDELMGQLIRFVSSHEVGHTLGLRHNMGSSSKTPVELLRNKAWVEAHGHTASIMDYARFNYVAQPEDNISETGLFPRIGDYDKWAIRWGYTPTIAATAEEDKKIVNKWIIDSLKANPRLWFGTETNPFDPHSQTEDLGDNNMKASEYGIKNLKVILQNLPQWTREEADAYENLDQMYNQLLGQFSRYMGHVVKNVGGIYEVPKTVEQDGDVYAPTPKATQKEAVAFLNKQLFETPEWLLNKNILNKISNPVSDESVSSVQTRILGSLLSGGRLMRMSISTNRYGAGTYSIDELITDVKKGVWSELATKKAISGERRNLQKAFVDALAKLIEDDKSQGAISGLPQGLVVLLGSANIKNTDVPSVARGQLLALQAQIKSAIPATTDKMSKYHLQDVSERIRRALDLK